MTASAASSTPKPAGAAGGSGSPSGQGAPRGARPGRYPAVVSGTFADEFLRLPEEVLTTTMIHHQHFFPGLGAGRADAGVPGRAQHGAGEARARRPQSRARAHGAAARRALLLGCRSRAAAGRQLASGWRRWRSTRGWAPSSTRPSASSRWPAGLPPTCSGRPEAADAARAAAGCAKPTWPPAWCAS